MLGSIDSTPHGPPAPVVHAVRSQWPRCATVNSPCLLVCRGHPILTQGIRQNFLAFRPASVYHGKQILQPWKLSYFLLNAPVGSREGRIRSVPRDFSPHDSCLLDRFCRHLCGFAARLFQCGITQDLTCGIWFYRV
jgi:hypothetical protein